MISPKETRRATEIINNNYKLRADQVVDDAIKSGAGLCWLEQRNGTQDKSGIKCAETFCVRVSCSAERCIQMQRLQSILYRKTKGQLPLDLSDREILKRFVISKNAYTDDTCESYEGVV